MQRSVYRVLAEYKSHNKKIVDRLLMKITPNERGSGYVASGCRALFICCLALSPLTGIHAASDKFIDLEATLGLDDNVTRAADNLDIEYDGSLFVSGTGGIELLSGRSGQLSAHVLLGAEQFFRFNGLSNLQASGKLKYSVSLGSGFHAPWLILDAAYGVTEFESFLRDSNIARASIASGMQIDDATTVRIGVNYKDRDAESAVFDTQNVSAFINLDWAVSRKDIVYLIYKYQTGDTFSSISPGQGRVAAITAAIDSEDIAIDDVFDGKVAYKLDADIQFLTLGYNMIQTLHSSFDFSVQYLESSATAVDLDYEDLVIRASYFHRFGL